MSELQLLLIVELPLLGLLIYMTVDVVRRADLPVAKKVGWVLALVLVPVIALALYIVLRPPLSAQVSGGASDAARAETVVLLAERRQRGELGDDEYRTEVAAVASVD